MGKGADLAPGGRASNRGGSSAPRPQVTQSRGWAHYEVHKPEPHILLFRRPLGTNPLTGKVDATKVARTAGGARPCDSSR